MVNKVTVPMSAKILFRLVTTVSGIVFSHANARVFSLSGMDVSRSNNLI